MIEIVKFNKKHIDDIVRRDSTDNYGHMQRTGCFDDIEEAYSAINTGTKEAIAIAGVTEYWPGRAEGWALLTTKTPEEFFMFHRAVQRFVAKYRGRLEYVARKDFVEGRRWATILGFAQESTLHDYYGQDSDAIMYVRRNW